MTVAGPLHGAMLLQRGTEDLVAVAGGTTGNSPDTECTLGTRFQIASVSKQFTAAAVLLLADRGVLSTDDPVRDWLDGCPAAWDRITVHHLLSHSGGLVHWLDLPGLDLTKPPSRKTRSGDDPRPEPLTSPRACGQALAGSAALAACSIFAQ
jgi:CubicO group peptidase (beta-lactamase class C family)